MALLPAPQNASIIVSHLHLSAISFAISSGVTENQLSKNNRLSLYIIYVYMCVYVIYIYKSIIL